MIAACATYGVVNLDAEAVVASSPDCRWQVKGNGDGRAVVVARASGRAVYRFSVVHTARFYWLRDRKAAIVELDPGPGEDGGLLALPLSPERGGTVDIGRKILPDLYRRSGFSAARSHPFFSYIRPGRVAVSLESETSGLPGRQSRCYVYAVGLSGRARFVGSRAVCGVSRRG